MNIKRVMTSCFGLGFLPIAPGTWGSLPSMVIFFLLQYFGVGAAVSVAVMLCIIVWASVVCVLFSPAISRISGKEDPGEIVVDEVAGQSLSYIPAIIMLGFLAKDVFVEPIVAISTAIVGFLAFRLFDIWKPSPCRQLEKLPEGWGILLDDLMAGVYASVALSVFVFSICWG